MILFENILKTPSLQTVKARELTFLEKVHLPQPVTFYVSQVMCHVSHVMCHVSRVTCHIFCEDKVVKLVCGESVINRAYPV